MTATRSAISIAIIGCAIVSTARAHSWLAECNIGFDNQFALSNVYSQARGTFAVPTGLTAGGQLEPCAPTRHAACWTYRERCGSRGYVNVEEKPRRVKRLVPSPLGPPGRMEVVIDQLRYGHFHLNFEDPQITCVANGADGLGSGFGRNMSGSCIAADWKREPRFAMTHRSDQPLRVWVEDQVTHAPRIFDVVSIDNRRGKASQVWFITANGTVYGWPRLEPNVWNISADAWEIKELFISPAAGETGQIAIDNIVVRN